MKIICSWEIWPRFYDPAMGGGDPGVQAMLPAPTSGHHALPLAAVQEAEAGNGILFPSAFAISIIPVPEGCFEDKRKSKMCTVFVNEQMGDMTATLCASSPGSFYIRRRLLWDLVFLVFSWSSLHSWVTHYKGNNENFSRAVMFSFPGFAEVTHKRIA